jgi:antirestriction protein
LPPKIGSGEPGPDASRRTADSEAPAGAGQAGPADDHEPETTTPPPDLPRIWVGSWLDYNNGVLHGDWIDAARPDDEVWADITAMLLASPTAAKSGETAEDWGIFDFEAFGPLRIAEQESITYVTAVARGIAEYGPAFAAWADVMEDEEALSSFADNYLGAYDSAAAYAEQLFEDFGYSQLLDDVLPDGIRRYVTVDSAGLAQDMWLSGDIQICRRDDGGVWIFRGG